MSVVTINITIVTIVTVAAVEVCSYNPMIQCHQCGRTHTGSHHEHHFPWPRLGAFVEDADVEEVGMKDLHADHHSATLADPLDA